MNIIRSNPPNYDQIVAALGEPPHNAIYAYGTAVYVPNGRPLTRELEAHEGTHLRRQARMGVEAWWEQYLSNDQFRFHEELLACAAEYQEFCRNSKSVEKRRQYMSLISQRFAAPMYKLNIAPRDAKNAITGILRYAVGL